MERWEIRTGYSGLISNKFDSRLVEIRHSLTIFLENERRWKQWHFDGERTVHSNYFRLTRHNKVPFSIHRRFKDYPFVEIASVHRFIQIWLHSRVSSSCHHKSSYIVSKEKTNLTWTNQIQALFSSWPIKNLNCDKQVIDENNSHVDQSEKMF